VSSKKPSLSLLVVSAYYFNGSTDVCSKVTPVESICLLNVVVKQEILIKTQKTKQATSCRVTRNRVPFITRYCIFIHVRIDIIHRQKYAIHLKI